MMTKAKKAKKRTTAPGKTAARNSSSKKPPIRVKRAYEPPASSDGLRILVDRLWPRGVSKAKLKISLWAKDIAPSNELRKWYQHDPKKYVEFRRRYLGELKGQREGLGELRAAIAGRTVTLLTATRELDLSQAAVLRDLLAKASR